MFVPFSLNLFSLFLLVKKFSQNLNIDQHLILVRQLIDNDFAIDYYCI